MPGELAGNEQRTAEMSADGCHTAEAAEIAQLEAGFDNIHEMLARAIRQELQANVDCPCADLQVHGHAAADAPGARQMRGSVSIPGLDSASLLAIQSSTPALAPLSGPRSTLATDMPCLQLLLIQEEAAEGGLCAWEHRADACHAAPTARAAAVSLCSLGVLVMRSSTASVPKFWHCCKCFAANTGSIRVRGTSALGCLVAGAQHSSPALLPQGPRQSQLVFIARWA